MKSLAALRKEAKHRGVSIPKPSTFERYGWTEREWLAMLAGQGWVCPPCGKFPKTGRFVTDHEHVRGWSGLPDQIRKLYVRGLTCWSCNRYLLARGISVEVAQAVANYLARYAKRRPQ